jgi:Asp-tRNA(Asn)/Glu-tRNA(Gln) amidotransferase A subunit family amidase
MMKSGPIAASSLDAALTHALISRNAPPERKKSSFYSTLYDGGVRGPPMPHLQDFSKIEDLSDVRIGIFTEWFDDSVPVVRERCKEALKFLTARGAKIVNIHIPHLQIMSIAHAMRISTEFAMSFDSHFYAYPDRSDMMNVLICVGVGLGS